MSVCDEIGAKKNAKKVSIIIVLDIFVLAVKTEDRSSNSQFGQIMMNQKGILTSYNFIIYLSYDETLLIKRWIVKVQSVEMLCAMAMHTSLIGPNIHSHRCSVSFACTKRPQLLM